MLISFVIHSAVYGNAHSWHGNRQSPNDFVMARTFDAREVNDGGLIWACLHANCPYYVLAGCGCGRDGDSAGMSFTCRPRPNCAPRTTKEGGNKVAKHIAVRLERANLIALIKTLSLHPGEQFTR
jgi:hypothetical protein